MLTVSVDACLLFMCVVASTLLSGSTSGGGGGVCRSEGSGNKMPNKSLLNNSTHESLSNKQNGMNHTCVYLFFDFCIGCIYILYCFE